GLSAPVAYQLLASARSYHPLEGGWGRETGRAHADFTVSPLPFGMGEGPGVRGLPPRTQAMPSFSTGQSWRVGRACPQRAGVRLREYGGALGPDAPHLTLSQRQCHHAQFSFDITRQRLCHRRTTFMRKYNVGIIGYGWAASGHIPAINAVPLAQVTAICSSRKLDAAELSAKHGGSIALYNKLNDLLANPAIDAVSICSYPPDHARQVIAAAKAGKHLIIE